MNEENCFWNREKIYTRIDRESIQLNEILADFNIRIKMLVERVNSLEEMILDLYNTLRPIEKVEYNNLKKLNNF